MGKPTPSDLRENVAPTTSADAIPLASDLDHDQPSSSSDPLLDPPPPAYQEPNTPSSYEIHDQPPPSLPVNLSHTLTTDSHALRDFLFNEQGHHPHPFLRITGTHRVSRSSGNDTNSKTVTDFDLYIDIDNWMNYEGGGELYVVSPSVRTFRGTRTRRPSGQQLALPMGRSWLEDQIAGFTDSGNLLKTFTLKKRLGVEEEYIREHLTRIIRSTNYLGKIEISFPCERGEVLIARDNWANRIRYSSYRWLLIPFFLLLWPLLWCMTLRWETVQIIFRTDRAEGQCEERFMTKYGKAVGRMCRMGVKRRVGEGELKGVLEGMEREGRGEEERGLAGVVRGVLRGVAEGLEDIRGGWGGDC